MSINSWPNDDKPREKLLNKGEASLTDAELIAIFINTGIRGKTALDIAKELLRKYGSLRALLRSSAISLRLQPGIGKAKYATLKAALELGKRYLGEDIKSGDILNSSKQAQLFVADRLRDAENEIFACLFLDTRMRLLRFEELFHGTIHSASVYPREIVKRGLQFNAAKIILAHNHPSGDPLPSHADKEVTRLVKQALALVDITVVDHIIVGHKDTFSFADMGLM